MNEKKKKNLTKLFSSINKSSISDKLKYLFLLAEHIVHW